MVGAPVKDSKPVASMSSGVSVTGAVFDGHGASGGATLRRAPVQARGQATVSAILDATAVLIEDLGPEAVTTNLIASAAKINIATLYQYFSNKQAILMALYDRQLDERAEVGAGRLLKIVPGDSWRQAVEEAVDATMLKRRSQPGSAAIRLAVRLSPDLQQHDRADSVRSAQVISDLLHRWNGMDRAQALVVGRVAVEMTAALLDMWSFESDPDDLAFVEEAKKAAVSYLANYFEPT